jgi:hypothetical protein
MWRLVTLGTAFFLVCWPALAAVFRGRGFADPGALWHVRVGELVLRHGIIRTDPFTFPFEGRTWIPQQWGGEVLMAIAHAVGGFDAMLQGFAVLMAACFAWLFGRLLRGGMGWPLAAVVAAFAVVAAGFHFYVRPHLATIALTAIVAGVLVDYDRRRIGPWRLAWLIPLHVLWTNIHGGMLGGVMMVGVCAIGTTIMERRFAATRSGALWLVTLGCALSMFVNPIGLELQRTWFRIVGSPAMARHVGEHSPLDPARPGDQAVIAFAALFLLVLAGTRPRDWRVTWLLPLVWLALTVKGVRQGPLFVVTAAVVIADAWPHTRWHRWLAARGDLLTRDPDGPLPSGRAAGLVPAALVAASLALIAAGVRVPVVGAGWAYLPPETVPTDMIDAVRDHAHRGTRIYNDANFGGFLIYFASGAKIFMDDRFELCGDRWLDDYVDTIDHHHERFEDWYAEYRFPLALVAAADPPLPLEAYIRGSGRWREVARGRSAVLYERLP